MYRLGFLYTIGVIGCTSMRAMEANRSIVSPRQVESGLTTKSIWNDYQSTVLSGNSNILENILSNHPSTKGIRNRLFSLSPEHLRNVCQGAQHLALIGHPLPLIKLTKAILDSDSQSIVAQKMLDYPDFRFRLLVKHTPTSPLRHECFMKNQYLLNTEKSESPQGPQELFCFDLIKRKYTTTKNTLSYKQWYLVKQGLDPISAKENVRNVYKKIHSKEYLYPWHSTPKECCYTSATTMSIVEKSPAHISSHFAISDGILRVYSICEGTCLVEYDDHDVELLNRDGQSLFRLPNEGSRNNIGFVQTLNGNVVALRNKDQGLMLESYDPKTKQCVYSVPLSGSIEEGVKLGVLGKDSCIVVYKKTVEIFGSDGKMRSIELKNPLNHDSDLFIQNYGDHVVIADRLGLLVLDQHGVQVQEFSFDQRSRIPHFIDTYGTYVAFKYTDSHLFESLGYECSGIDQDTVYLFEAEYPKISTVDEALINNLPDSEYYLCKDILENEKETPYIIETGSTKWDLYNRLPRSIQSIFEGKIILSVDNNCLIF